MQPFEENDTLSREWEACACGRTFSQPSASNHHKRSCPKTKKRLSSALGKAKEKWLVNKRRKIQASQFEEGISASDGSSQRCMPGLTALSEISPGTSNHSLQVYVDEAAPGAEDDSDIHLTLMERKQLNPRKNRSRLPTRFRDLIPQPAPPLGLSHSEHPINSSLAIRHTSPSADDTNIAHGTPLLNRVYSETQQIFRTPRNVFGIFRSYEGAALPSFDPEEEVTLQDLSNVPSDSLLSEPKDFYPYPNRAAFRLGDWHWNGGAHKSLASFQELISIVGDPEFQSADVRDVNWDRINKELGTDEDVGEWLDDDAGWTRTPITISVPYQSRRGVESEIGAGPRNYTVPEFYHRNLVSVIKEKITGLGETHQFHFEPYELLWQRNEGTEPVRVHGELYTSPAFIRAHREIQDLPREPDCDLPRVVTALMFWSDSTQLTAFGNGKLWPLYMYFGNESKYRRGQPTEHLSEHVAYFQTLPDSFKDFASSQTAGKKAPSSAFMTHCHRELFHAQWLIILDDDFIDAWRHGIVILCSDGIKRRFYPRIFTYSADYPEKILIATIRNLGACPCPRCFIPLNRVHNLGMIRDMTQRKTLVRVDDTDRQSKVIAARRVIYTQKFQVNSAGVEAMLRKESWVPTMNAFSERLSPHGLKVFKMLLPDIMHEVELGVWRAIFIHLLRILQSIDDDLLVELDRRYRQIPSFGRDTIRRFAANCSEMKKMAAHDFENLLQCSIVVFDGLLPEPHNQAVKKLLFAMNKWHSLAKLRIHNDYTLDFLDAATADLGDRLRKFSQTTCPAFPTRELRREYDARIRRQTKRAAANARVVTSVATSDAPASGTGTMAEPPVLSSTPNNDQRGRRIKTFNVNTFKTHSLGDYASTIREYGTTDSYSTEPGELEHRSSKSRYTRTSRKNFLRQMTQIERRQVRLRRIRAHYKNSKRPPNEHIPHAPGTHHVIGHSQNFPEHIPTFLRRNQGDPAILNFLPKLKDHILPRIREVLRQEATLLNEDVIHPQLGLSEVARSYDSHNSIYFKNERMYRHHLARFNYTTYDIRRNQDVINPNTSHCDIMLLADRKDGELTHTFLYARVLGIYHVNVIYTGENSRDYAARRVEFLWVRWLDYSRDRQVEWSDMELDPVHFPPMANESSFGFVDPSDVIRSFHLLPNFCKGRARGDGVGLSKLACDADDWSQYCVNRFADRDMMMRYHWGLAAGHTYAHAETNAPAHNNLPSTPIISAVDEPGVDIALNEEREIESDSILLEHMTGDDDAEGDPELSFANREDDVLEEHDSVDNEEDDSRGYIDNDEEYFAMYEMYGNI